jgi:type II secretion system protein I
MRAGTRGFTLIEVLAALVIVALGMLGVIQAVTQTVRNGTYLREKTLAHWIAMNVITERRLMNAPPPVGETSEEVEFANQRWRWTLKVTQTQVASLRRMDVAVRPAEKPEGTALTTVSGFYGSAIGAAGGGVLPWANGQVGAATGEDDGADGTGDGPSSEDRTQNAEKNPAIPRPVRPDRGTVPPSQREPAPVTNPEYD